MRLLFFLLALVLSACSITPKIVPTEDASLAWNERKSYLYQHEQWIAHLSVVGETEQEKFKTRIIWEQKPDTYQIKLRDFIGRTVALIEGSPGKVTVKTSKGKHYEDQDAEKLIYSLFGLRIPVIGLRYWLRGVPHPDKEYQELRLREDGVAESILQEGWQLSYLSYSANNPLQMPANAMFQYDDLSLTVKIARWDLPSIQ